MINHGKQKKFVMAAPIPLRSDFNAEMLRRGARRSRDVAQARIAGVGDDLRRLLARRGRARPFEDPQQLRPREPVA